jgi:hypothetical protein
MLSDLSVGTPIIAAIKSNLQQHEHEVKYSDIEE